MHVDLRHMMVFTWNVNHIPFSSFLALVFSLGSSLLSGQETIIVINPHNDGPGSLRQTVIDSLNDDTIVFDASLDGATITLTDDQLSIDKNLTIDASSLSIGIIIDANAGPDDQRRILEVREIGTQVTLIGITFINGYGPNYEREDLQHIGAPGGAILNYGSLTLTNCSFFYNRTGNGSFLADPSLNAYEASGGGGPGGAIANAGEVTATHCIFKHNHTGRGNEGSFVAGDAGFGGAIFNREDGTFTMDQCVLSHNMAANGSRSEPGGWEGIGGEGGAITNGGTFTLKDCTLTDNRAGDGSIPTGEIGGSGGNGGAISNWSNLTLVGCTLANNRAGDGGGGQPGGDGGAVSGGYSFSRCTFVNNRAGDGGIVGTFRGEGGNGGAISGGGLILNCTIVNNKAGLGGFDRPGKGGGVHGSVFEVGRTQFSHCIVSGNNAVDAPNIYGLINEAGPNLISSESPLILAPLGNYGGPTHTMPPLPGSPAIDTGATLDSGDPDQRGFAGFIDGDDSGTPVVDIGAVEFQGQDAEIAITFDLDSDGDGMTTGLESAIGRNPLVPDSDHPNNLRILGFDSETGETFLTFGYHNNGIRLKLLKSTNLIDFEIVVADSEITPDFVAQEGTELMKIKDHTPLVEKSYYRLHATQKF